MDGWVPRARPQPGGSRSPMGYFCEHGAVQRGGALWLVAHSTTAIIIIARRGAQDDRLLARRGRALRPDREPWANGAAETEPRAHPPVTLCAPGRSGLARYGTLPSRPPGTAQPRLVRAPSAEVRVCGSPNSKEFRNAESPLHRRAHAASSHFRGYTRTWKRSAAHLPVGRVPGSSCV